MKRLSILLLLSASMLWLNAASGDVVADSISGNERTAYADSLSILNWAPGWAKEYLNSLMRGNVDRTHERKLDLSFAVTPSYTREAGFGIGGACHRIVSCEPIGLGDASVRCFPFDQCVAQRFLCAHP